MVSVYTQEFSWVPLRLPLSTFFSDFFTFVALKCPFLFHHNFIQFFCKPIFSLGRGTLALFSLPASIAKKNSGAELNWVSL